MFARTLILVALAATPLAAQAPKSGDWYEEDRQLGIRFRQPKDWAFFPSKPGELHVVGKFDAGKDVQIAPNTRIRPTAYLVKFDGRPVTEGEGRRRRHETAYDWLRASVGVASGWKEIERKPLKGSKLAGEEIVFEGYSRNSDQAPIRAFAAVFEAQPDIGVALVYTGPGEKKWAKYESAFRKLAKTMRSVPLLEVDAPTGVGSGSLRALKRAELEAQIASQPGWELRETPNYFVVTNSDDKAFLDELCDRIEAIRAVFEEDYPPETARVAKPAPKEPGDPPDDDEPNPDDELRSTASSLELSRTSVVRVCASREDYMSYGAPGSSAGYWSARHRELVLYNKKKEQGEAKTWETLSHEAFHQYTYYFYGSLSPHSWFNEGTGDYYGGMDYARKKFKRAPRQNRYDTIKKLLREERVPPLNEVVRWSQAQYYGGNPYGVSGFECYSVGWSIVYFLRVGPDKARGWNSDWERVLPTYLETLVDTGDLGASVSAAFSIVDWEEFTSCWRRFIEKTL